MQTRDTTNVHQFLDCDEDTGIVNQFFKLYADDREAGVSFLREHAPALTEDQVTSLCAAMDSDDPDEDLNTQEVGDLLNEMRRTPEEILEAYNQVWDRRWYGRADKESRLSMATSPEMLTKIAAALDEREAVFGDLQDEKYYDQFGWGYLAGIQSALCWVMGSHWMMLDT